MTLTLILPSGDHFLWGLKFDLLFLIAWLSCLHTFSSGILYHFLLALDSDWMARLGQGICYSLHPHRAERVWGGVCTVLWDAHLSFLDVLIIATVSHQLKRTLSSCQSLRRPFLFQPVTAHVPFSFLLLTFAVWISDFLCSDDYNWGTVLRHSDVPDSTQTLCGFIFLTGFIYSWGLTLPEVKHFFFNYKRKYSFLFLLYRFTNIRVYMFPPFQKILSDTLRYIRYLRYSQFHENACELGLC